MLVGMPEPQDLRRVESQGQVLIVVGATVLYGYAADDAGMRNALTLLADELNTTPAHLPGDRRPITYHVTDTLSFNTDRFPT